MEYHNEGKWKGVLMRITNHNRSLKQPHAFEWIWADRIFKESPSKAWNYLLKFRFTTILTSLWTQTKKMDAVFLIPEQLELTRPAYIVMCNLYVFNFYVKRLIRI
jgi:hypothetical protein